MYNLWCSSRIRTGSIIIFDLVNDIQYAITNAKIKLFADDTNVFFHSKDLVKLFTLANAGTRGVPKLFGLIYKETQYNSDE